MCPCLQSAAASIFLLFRAEYDQSVLAPPLLSKEGLTKKPDPVRDPGFTLCD